MRMVWQWWLNPVTFECSVKQKWALLKSNSPRDSRINGNERGGQCAYGFPVPSLLNSEVIRPTLNPDESFFWWRKTLSTLQTLTPCHFFTNKVPTREGEEPYFVTDVTHDHDFMPLLPELDSPGKEWVLQTFHSYGVEMHLQPQRGEMFIETTRTNNL